MSDLTFRELQREQWPWSVRNFGEHPAWMPLLGVMEELGELAHAHLKATERVRGTPEEHAAKARDAIGDVVIFLADYCSAQGYDFQDCVEATWASVQQRDWKANPRNGHRPLEALP